MGIKIINSFDLNSPLPLDSRAIANNISEMNELITKNFVVAGQMCYNKADNKLYILKTNESNVLTWYEIADSVDIDNVNKVLPTDIAVKNNKLGLEHNNTWLTNQNAINLGANLEYDATTKTLNAKGGGGGESVSPTLSLIDLNTFELRTTITEQEKINLTQGLYNQVIYSESKDGNVYELYSPSKVIVISDSNIFFAMFDGYTGSGENYSVTTMSFYQIIIGTKNVSGEYPITINKGFSLGLGSGGGSSEIPTLSTIAPSMSDLTTTVYSDDDIALIKKQKDNFIKVPFGTAENNTSELCYVSYGNKYSLIDVAGNMLSVVNAFSESPTFLYFNLDETNKKLVGESYSALSATDTSLYVESSVNKIFLTDQLTLSSPTQVLNKAYYFDKINGKSIIHEENTINNYTIPAITFED